MVRRSIQAIFFILFAAPCFATTIDFTRIGTADWAQTTQLQGLTLHGATEIDGEIQTGSTEVGHSRYGGLGIKSAEDTAIGTDQMDSYGANDVVVLNFDRTVRLDRITFTMTDYFDRFDLYLGDSLTLDRTHKVDDFRGYDWISTVFLGAGYESNTFAIGASEYEACGYDPKQGRASWTENSAFKISSITFTEVEPPVHLQPIPLPASLPLMAVALLGFGAISARHRKTV